MSEPEMWEHYCEVEHSMMGVGKGEPCNWCEKTEGDVMKEKNPEPYRNEAKEALEILSRMEEKLDVLIEQQNEHLSKEHPRDDFK